MSESNSPPPTRSSAVLNAGAPIEPIRHPVGRATTLIVDPARANRMLGVDIWYPAATESGQRSTYELLPGIGFSAAAAQPNPVAAPGLFPLVLFSHGRTGMRFSYSLLCEALASRGAIVVAPDHPGDGLADWLLGTFVDDRANEIARVADAHLLIDSLLGGHEAFAADVTAAIDRDRVVLAGHSYGAYTAFATVAGARGLDPHPAVRAVIGFQPYTRTLSDRALARVHVPAMLVVGTQDRSTPAATDADRPWSLLAGHPTWRVDIAGAGHQASSDLGLYSELIDHIPALPAQIRDYFAETVIDAVAPELRPWRELLQEQIDATWAFLDVVFEADAGETEIETRRLASEPGITLSIR